MNDEGRKTYACPPDLSTFIHETMVSPFLVLGIEPSARVPDAVVATCITIRPQLRCNCGMFDLYWEPTAAESDPFRGFR